MTELFDMIAGSETGAIIGTVINLPNTDASTNSTQPNMYFASDARDWFKENNTKLYHNPKMPTSVKVLLALAFFALVGPLIYCCTEKAYVVPNFEKHYGLLRDIIKEDQQMLKANGAAGNGGM